jgi:myo-inositol-1(or 4)-monophosphatase
LIDPLDGTTNFAHGYPIFSVSIALESHGRLELGVVYQPIHGELFVARAGAGAELNGTRLRVSSVAALNASLVCSGFPYERSELSAALSIWAAVVPRAQGARRAGSAALDLCYVAAGRLDGYWERPLRPWDIAAGALMVQEAGGRVTGFRGTSLALREGDIVASNGLIHGQLLEAMRHGMAPHDRPGRLPAQR